MDELKMTTDFFHRHVFVCKYENECLGPNINRNSSFVCQLISRLLNEHHLCITLIDMNCPLPADA